MTPGCCCCRETKVIFGLSHCLRSTIKGKIYVIWHAWMTPLNFYMKDKYFLYLKLSLSKNILCVLVKTQTCCLMYERISIDIKFQAMSKHLYELSIKHLLSSFPSFSQVLWQYILIFIFKSLHRDTSLVNGVDTCCSHLLGVATSGCLFLLPLSKKIWKVCDKFIIFNELF